MLKKNQLPFDHFDETCITMTESLIRTFSVASTERKRQTTQNYVILVCFDPDDASKITFELNNGSDAWISVLEGKSFKAFLNEFSTSKDDLTTELRSALIYTPSEEYGRWEFSVKSVSRQAMELSWRKTSEDPWKSVALHKAEKPDEIIMKAVCLAFDKAHSSKARMETVEYELKGRMSDFHSRRKAEKKEFEDKLDKINKRLVMAKMLYDAKVDFGKKLTEKPEKETEEIVKDVPTSTAAERKNKRQKTTRGDSEASTSKSKH